MLVVNGASSSSWGFFYAYGAPTPVLCAVRGCDDRSEDNSTVNCAPGQQITLLGDSFTNAYPNAPSNAGFYIRIGWNRIVKACTIITPQIATCTLPDIETRQFGDLLTVEVMTFVGSTPARQLVEYRPPAPTVDSANGCSGQEGAMTTGCKAGDIITIWGSRFDVGRTRAFVGGVEALCVTFHKQDYSILAQLPPLLAELLNQSLPVLVESNGVNSSTAPLIVSYTPYPLDVYATYVCRTQYTDRTSGCRPGMLMTAVGVAFLSTSRIYLADYSLTDLVPCVDVQLVNSTRATCYLPPVNMTKWGYSFTLVLNQTWADGELSTAIFRNAVSYKSNIPIILSASSSSSSPSSTSAPAQSNISSSSSSSSSTSSSSSSVSTASSVASYSSSTASPILIPSSSSTAGNPSSDSTASGHAGDSSVSGGFSTGAIVGIAALGVLLGGALLEVLLWVGTRTGFIKLPCGAPRAGNERLLDGEVSVQEATGITSLLQSSTSSYR